MYKDYFFKLTEAVYKVSGLFPKGEPLKFKIREKSLSIFNDSLLISPNPGVEKAEDLSPKIKKDIEIINSFFDLAQSRKWIDEKNFLVLKKEYEKVSRYLDLMQNQKLPEKKKVEKNKSNIELNPRQEKIIEILKEKKSAQAGEILNFFEGVTKRTLRRDLGNLAEAGVIERIGKTNQIFYKLPDNR